MEQSMQPLTPSSPVAELASAVAVMSRAFARMFGQRWSTQGSDPKTLATWEAALRDEGVDAVALRRGLRAAKRLAWPPTLGEFIELCHGPTPDLPSALAEAARWARTIETHDGAWSHPAVGAAARLVGVYALTHLPERTLAQRFEPHYRAAIVRHRRGEALDLPLRQLRHDCRPTAEAVAINDRKRQLIRETAELLGVPSRV